jgi:hypothetical protein
VRSSYPIFPTLHQHILLAMDLMPGLKQRKDKKKKHLKHQGEIKDVSQYIIT